MTVQEFVRKYTPHANRVAVMYGVPSLVTLAQAAWESGWGRSAPKFNFFGMTAGSNYGGKTQLLSTWEVVGGQRIKVKREFRAYDNPTQAFSDYARNLASKEQFRGAFQWKHKPEQFFKEIANNGYATDPDYYKSVMMVMKMIKKHVI